MSQRIHRLTFAILVGIVALAPIHASAEGWIVKSWYHNTTTATCMNTAVAAFKGVAGTLQRGKQVVYGYDLGGINNYDAIIICQRPRGADRTEKSQIAVVFAEFDLKNTKTTRRKRKKFRDVIYKRYKSFALTN